MSKQIKIVISVLLLLGLGSAALYPRKLELISPRLSMPAVVKAGQSIDVRVKHSFPFNFGDWQLWLQAKGAKHAGQPPLALTLQSKQAALGSTVLHARLPGQIEAGAYELKIKNDGLALSEHKAVHVVNGFSDDLTIIQLADLPTLGGDGSGDKKLAAIIDEINIINPNVVLFTGDVAYGGGWDQYHRLMGLLKQVDAPIIAVPGNHEYYGWAGYLTLLGKPYHRVQFGEFEFLSLNSGHGRDQLTQSQLSWLAVQLATSQQPYKLLQLHHPIHHRPELGGYLRANSEVLTGLIKANAIKLVLSGHWHGDSVYDESGADRTDTWQFPGTPFVVTTTAGSDLRPAYSNSPLHYGYRLIRFVDGELESYTYDYDGDGERDAASSIPIGNLSIRPRGRFGVLVHNGLNEGFTKAKVEVSIPDAKNEYYPSKGEILSRHRGQGQSTYTVLVDLPANRDTVITMVMQGFNE